ncbi:MAG TPA: hypothetical protein VHR66_26565 [Gemmataceae bacterium]|jgi:hypothetical protein|nr:hypothetical protein [Gemmataceae bacterium]
MANVDELSVSDIRLLNNNVEVTSPATNLALKVTGAYSPTNNSSITVKLKANGGEVSHAGTPGAGSRFSTTFTVAELTGLGVASGMAAKVVVDVTNPAFTNDSGGALTAEAVRNFTFA